LGKYSLRSRRSRGSERRHLAGPPPQGGESGPRAAHHPLAARNSNGAPRPGRQDAGAPKVSPVGWTSAAQSTIAAAGYGGLRYRLSTLRRTEQAAAVATAQRKIAEVEAAMAVANGTGL